MDISNGQVYKVDNRFFLLHCNNVFEINFFLSIKIELKYWRIHKVY